MGTGSSKTVKRKHALTPKQRAFVEAVASGDAANLTEAYRMAGYESEGSKSSTLHTSASRLARNPHVEPSIEERRVAIAKETQANVAASRRWVLQRLRMESENEDSPANARVSALALLARASGALNFEENENERRKNASEDELVAELEAKLAHLLPGIGATDVNAAPIEVESMHPECEDEPVPDDLLDP